MPVERELLQERLRADLELVDSAVQIVRRISSELRPSVLDHLGLTAAIEWQVKEFGNRSEIPWDISIDIKDIDLDKDLSIAVFRIFQEALINVMRHAEATKINVNLLEREGFLILELIDDGKGIPIEKLSDSHSFGLMGMRERVQYLRGDLEIKGIINKGITVTVKIPREGQGGSMIKILIADDHAVVRKGVRHILSELPDDVTANEAGDSYEVIDNIRKNDYDLVLLDIAMPGKDGLEVLKQIKTKKPKLPVLILSMFPEEQFALRALKSGASGYLTKESIPEELLKAVQKILRGGKYVSESFSDEILLALDRDLEKLPHETLSDREYQVMLMIAAGKTRKQIAEKLFLDKIFIRLIRTRRSLKLCQ